MDLVSIIYAFMLATGTGQFAVNDAVEIAPNVHEVDVETLGMRENQRYILIIDQGKITQQARVPLTDKECKQPH